MANIFEDLKRATIGQRVIIKDESGESDLIIMEATIRETHTLESQVVDHAIEDGSMVSDHVIDKPIDFVMDCIISDTPIRLFNAAQGVAELIEDPEGENRRSLVAWRELKRIRDNKLLVRVITGLETYKNMVIKRISVPRTAQNSNSLSFTLELRQIKKAVLTQLETERSDDSTDIAQPKKGEGKKKTETPSEDQAPAVDEKKSVLKAVIGG